MDLQQELLRLLKKQADAIDENDFIIAAVVVDKLKEIIGDTACANCGPHLVRLHTLTQCLEPDCDCKGPVVNQPGDQLLEGEDQGAADPSPNETTDNDAAEDDQIAEEIAADSTSKYFAVSGIYTGWASYNITDDRRHRSDSEMSGWKLVHSIGWHTTPCDFETEIALPKIR